MLKHRYFVDHAGRLHRVRKSEDEIYEGWKFAAGFVAVTTFCGVVLTIASGILA